MRSRLPGRFFFFFLSFFWACAAPAAEKTSTAIADALGEGPVSPDTERGYKEFYAGDLEAALQSLNAVVSKHKQEHAALYALGLCAAAQNDMQNSLEVLCQAFNAAKQSPWAELYLVQAVSLLPFCSDPQPFLNLVRQEAHNDKLRPHLKDLLVERQAEWLLRRGQFDSAAAARQPLQYLEQWALAGPLDNRDGAGLATEYEPEKLVDFEKSLTGRNRKVNWFEPGVKPLDGRINLSEIFEPRIHVLAYGVTFVKAKVPGWAVLRAGCAGALAIWVNGRQAGILDTYNDFGSDKLVVPVFLQAGWNQILVKSAVIEQTQWGFSMRLCRPAGGSFPELVCDCSAAAAQAYQSQEQPENATPPEKPQFDLGLIALLEERLAQQPDNIFLLAALGAMSDAYKLGNKEDRVASKWLAKAVALAPASPHLRILQASAAADKNEARQALETAWRGHSELPLVAAMLASLALESNLRISAEDYARAALDKFGAEKAGLSCVVLAKELAGPKDRHGEYPGDNDGRAAAALRLLRPYVERHPYLPAVWQLIASLEEGRPRRQEVLRKALSYCGGDHSLRRLYAEDLAVLGKNMEAAEFTAAGLPARPFSIAAVLEASTQYRRAGDMAYATAVLERARQWAPENPELLGALGELWHYLGRTTEAAALFREALRLKPNSPHLKDYLSQLDEGGGLDRKFFEPYDLALKNLLMPKAEAYPHDNAVTILNQEVVRVNPNGSSSRMVHLVAKVLRDAGAHELARHYVYYEPQRQVVDILRAAVIAPDGRELSQANVSDHATSAAMGVRTLIYDEHHLKAIQFQGLEPGDCIDLQYTLRDTGDNIYGDYFADTFYLSGAQPTLMSQYVLDYPKQLAIQTRTFNTKAAAERIAAEDPQREILKWELCNSPGMMGERNMPPMHDQFAQLQATTMKSWREVGRWYWNLAKDQLAANEQMRATVAELIKDCKTQTDKLRAIHEWAVRKIRYLGVEFGRFGYKPHKALETYKALYGDCKDTATLLATLLPLAGIDCRLVLLRTVNAGAVPADSLALPNLFNHCIAYVPDVDGQAYWLDGTAQYYRLGEIPWSDQDAQALVVSASDGEFMRIPTLGSRQTMVEQTFTAGVAKDGSGTLTLHQVSHGEFAAGYRAQAETPGQCERYLKDYAARSLNGAELLTGAGGEPRLKMAKPDEKGPLWLECEFKVPALAARSGERLALPATFEPLNLSQQFAVETERKYDLELRYCSSRKREMVFKLDEGLKVAALPEEAEVNEPFGKYTRKLAQHGALLTIDEEFELTHHRILTAEYERFRAFCHKVDSLLEQKVLLETK